MEYSAGMVSCLFWVSETRKTAELLVKGISNNEIKELAVKENIYQVRAEDRAKRIANLSIKRLEVLSKDLIEQVAIADIATCKLLVLICTMKTDLLFYEFVHSVYRQAIILGEGKVTDAAINIFFDNKINQSETVARFSESVIKKLKRTYNKILNEAGVLDSPTGERKIIVPLVDYRIHKMISDAGLEIYLNALMGDE